MTINVKVTVPETANWRARIVSQYRANDAGTYGEYADANETTLEPGTSQDYAVTDTHRVLVEEIPLADTKSAADEAGETDNGGQESNAG